jgi:uncharacterized protein YeaO (DUF488 family)
MKVHLKRIYETPQQADGTRVLVDRLWPRGISKEAARLDFWLKDIAPSDELRKWYGHIASRWEQFRRAYLKELQDKQEQLDFLIGLLDEGTSVTLLYSARDHQRNQAVILKQLLSGRFSREKTE